MSPPSFPHVCISPAGHPYLGNPEPEQAADYALPKYPPPPNASSPGTEQASQPPSIAQDRVASVLENRLQRAFHSDLAYAKGLLHLATVELETTLPSDFDFLRTFAKNYLTRLCHLPELGAATDKVVSELPPVSPPPAFETEFFLMSTPPMPGAEYLTAATLAEWWRELDRYVRTQIKKHPAGAADWIRQQSPLWRTVGRVTFHLAENKRDESRPFAFMATYTDKVSASAKPVQLPLSKALTEYASVQDRSALLRLLQPIMTAGEKCAWVQEMVDDQTVYQPRAWSPKQAYRLLQDIPNLEEAGLIVRVPDWWKGKHSSKPQVRVNVGTKDYAGKLDVASLLTFSIETVYEGEPLTKEELQELLTAENSLVRLRGEWVEVDKEKLQSALDHWKKIDKLVREDGLSFYEGMRLLSGLPVDGKWDELSKELSFREWSEVMPIGDFAEALATIRDPSQAAADFSFQQLGLNATLRPYQETGVHWLHLLTRLGLGACLADDMGLGKTIQVITLLLAIKQDGRPQTADGSRGATAPLASAAVCGLPSAVSPTSILVAPASLLGNWESELQKFAPSLKPHIAHTSGAGIDEPTNLREIDLVMTTYGMVERIDWIKKTRWRNVILDEAQAIKNAGTKQAKAVKELHTDGRIVLTGTPIENRLSDLWSLFDFLNPGLLGSNAAFSKFVKSLSKSSDKVNYAPLRRLTQPYILRRLKTDKKIISDLPDKTEVTAWCGLSKSQTSLYAQSVKQLAHELQEVRGDKGDMKRRGLILAYLMRFKQICNHPAQWTGDGDYDPQHSGKFDRLREICEEIASRQEKVLVFTQFREITEPLSRHLQAIFRRPGLILDGSTPIKKRKEMVDAFQTDSGPPFFVLSLKAGGTGLNLTAASQVIHFDRWWNPAVENQATDRAFRIGQRKNVLVHKFVCRGTIEERIDDLIEVKKSLAREIVEGSGGGETLVTEMSDEQLLQMVALDINRAQEN